MDRAIGPDLSLTSLTRSKRRSSPASLSNFSLLSQHQLSHFTLSVLFPPPPFRRLPPFTSPRFPPTLQNFLRPSFPFFLPIAPCLDSLYPCAQSAPTLLPSPLCTTSLLRFHERIPRLSPYFLHNWVFVSCPCHAPFSPTFSSLRFGCLLSPLFSVCYAFSVRFFPSLNFAYVSLSPVGTFALSRSHSAEPPPPLGHFSCDRPQHPLPTCQRIQFMFCPI